MAVFFYGGLVRPQPAEQHNDPFVQKIPLSLSQKKKLYQQHHQEQEMLLRNMSFNTNRKMFETSGPFQNQNFKDLYFVDPRYLLAMFDFPVYNS